MPNYPAPFQPTDFPPIPQPVEQKPPTQTTLLNVPVEVTSAVRIPNPEDAAITDLWFESVSDPSKRSQGFQNLDPSQNAGIDPGNHFYFLPGVDKVEIKWKVRRPGQTTKVKLELYSKLKATPVWVKEVNGKEASELILGTETKTSCGKLDSGEIQIAGDNVNFPHQKPNLHGAPYQLRATVTGSDGKVTTAWTYFDILVDSIRLRWGRVSHIPPGTIADVEATFAPLTDRDERALVGDLRKDSTDVDPTADFRLPLRSTNAAYVHLNEWYMWRDFAYLRYQARWGKGPRIPILARVGMKSLDSTDGVRSVGGAEALGPAEFLWDWRDKPEATRRNEMAGWNNAARTFVINALKYRENIADAPPDCLNCHDDRGGKRGGPDPIFPPFNNPAHFPFEVAAAGTRRWAAISKPIATGRYASYTGVIFQPSRMAYDSYQVRVFLASGYQATLDVAGVSMADLVNRHQGLPTAATGMMEVVRQVDARYVTKGASTPAIDLAAVATEYGKGGVRVQWTQANWGQAEYTNMMTAAMNPDNSNEDPGPVRQRIFRANAQARRRGLNNWKTQHDNTKDAPVKVQLPNYDQWFGCPAGQVAANASASAFTLPGRELALAPYISAVVQTYISKNRVSNDKLRKWNRLQAANPHTPAAELRVQFYHQSLKQSERDKIDPEIRRRYEADGWAGWDRPQNHAEEWASDNYSYRLSKLVYLAEEMHVRKVLADAFEGVTLFHYQHFLDALNPDGSNYARQCAIGGVAAISMNADLGLSGAFLVWDHPTNLQRQTLARQLCVRRGVAPAGGNGHTGPSHAECTFKDGNATVVHEFGHFLHLPHAAPTGGADEAAMHDANDAKCIMNYDPDALHLCGCCLIRLRGWAYFQSRGKRGFDRTNPNNAGLVPKDPQTAGLPALFQNFYATFV